jgi:protein-tyrosine phosphatase
MVSDDEEIFESSEHVYPCHVHDHIFLGSEFIAGQLPVLQHLKITHVLNVTHECKNYFEESNEYKVSYHRFKIHDKESEDLLSGLKECLNFIDAAISKQGKVLIHCAQGRSRSPSIVIAYLMYYHHMTYQQAHDVVLESRDYLHINDGFVRQLKALELELK